MPLSRILGDLADYLQYEADEGERAVECDPAVVRNLTQAPTTASPASPAAPRPAQPAPATRATTTRPAPAASPPPPQPPTAAAPATSATKGAPAPYQQFGSTPALDAIARDIAACTRCGLCRTRTHVVPGQGHAKPQLLFVGEGPGEDEDAQGLAFVGRSGQLVTRLIAAMGLSREDVWIGNVVKCRPPGNRVPSPEEMQACLPYLHAQLAQLQPTVIVALGATAVKGLLGPKVEGISRMRGRWQQFAGIDLMPTYHPSYLLRGGGEEKARYWEVWEDMCAVLRRLGKPVPERQRKPA